MGTKGERNSQGKLRQPAWKAQNGRLGFHRGHTECRVQYKYEFRQSPFQRKKGISSFLFRIQKGEFNICFLFVFL